MSNNRDALPLESLYTLWDAFGDVPIDAHENLAAPFQTPHQVFEAGTHREDVWRWFEDMNDAFVVGDVMAGKRVADAPVDAFVVSVHREKFAQDDLEAGESGEQDVLVDHETVDADDLEHYGRNYGLSELSGDPESPCACFISTYPDQTREHFEEGIDTYYRLHLHAVNGRNPSAADYRKVAALVGVSLPDPSPVPGM